MMNLENKTCKEAAMVHFKALSQHLPGRTDIDHEKVRSVGLRNGTVGSVQKKKLINL
jgi:hypothetical protein